ncbi:MAG: FAD-dependent oxidoreductase [Ardenticatenaceae bacterium]
MNGDHPSRFLSLRCPELVEGSKSRRDFVKLALIASGAALLVQCGGNVGNPSEKIIVVGAGMAGLSAARTLHDAGYAVTLLEGRERIGGRVWTSRAWADTPLDMGGSWIHGIRGNPITTLADAINAERIVTDYDDAILYDVDGRLLGERAWREIEQYETTVTEAIAKTNKSGDESSLEAAISEVIDMQSLSAKEKQHLNLFLNSNIEQEWAADVAELSVHYVNDGDEFGGDDVVFPNGYDELIKHLARGLDIRRGHVVEKITYNEESVSITTNKGTFEGDRAIVTLPIGVLQSRKVLFEPPLPSAKQEAIDTLGSGVLNKVYLRFPHVFWQKRPEWIFYLSAKRGEWSEWLNIFHYIKQPILMAFNAGRFGRAVESLSDEEMVAEAMAVLRNLYGDDIPEPDAWQITRWASDPFALGSYSFPAVGATRQTRETLAEPVANRLFFAGEATEPDYPATVHGAYLSGQREAERILAF